MGCAEKCPSPTQHLFSEHTRPSSITLHFHLLESFVVDTWNAVEREAHNLGRGIELRLQPLQLAHVAVPATPHAEGSEKEQI